MNEAFQHIQPGDASLTRRLPVSRRFPLLPWWLGQILPASRSSAAPPSGKRGAPLPRALAPVAPQADRSPPVGSLPDRPPGRGDERRRLEARSERRERQREAVVNSQAGARSHRIPLPTAPAQPVSSILPLSPVLPTSQAWHSIPAIPSTEATQPGAPIGTLNVEAEFKTQPARRNATVVPSQPARGEGELEADGHREYSIELAR